MKMRSEILEILFNTLPYVFWKDTSGKYQGGNINQARNLGFNSPDEFIGKTIFEILKDQKTAQLIDDADNAVMKNNATLIYEDKIVELSGEKIYLSQKSPIHDDKGAVIGMIGFAMDITDIKQQEELAKQERDNLITIAAQKEAERLKLENEARKAQLEAQEQFTKRANQVAHDIRSPLASLLMIVKSCDDIPERERVALREASTRISDIANNLLNQYQFENSELPVETEHRQPILLSATLLQLLTEKKFQYQDASVSFDCQLTNTGQFAFIEIEPSPFKRMISNLINNAVDSFESAAGIVTLKLTASDEWINIIVQDNGKGMPSALIEKIMNKIAVTEGKVDGNGIGLTQVHETLARNFGTMSIQSKIGQGTQIMLSFPRTIAPSWIVENITFGLEDIVIILDDDRSIHSAWDSRFELILKQAPEMKVYHFESASKALNFIESLTEEEIKHVLLLTDFELLKQKMNGLDVVEQSGMQRSILVTSHYDNPAIQNRATKLNSKILPKQLASEVPMTLNKSIHFNDDADKLELKLVDAVLVDDDEQFAATLLNYVFDDDRVDYFKDPEQFKDNVDQYPKDTRIYLDNNFASCSIRGVEIAKELHDKGYTHLYLMTGECFKSNDLPSYLTVILKTDIDNIKDW
jgi:PAS domain S-box-containing protein